MVRMEPWQLGHSGAWGGNQLAATMAQFLETVTIATALGDRQIETALVVDRYPSAWPVEPPQSRTAWTDREGNQT